MKKDRLQWKKKWDFRQLFIKILTPFQITSS